MLALGLLWSAVVLLDAERGLAAVPQLWRLTVSILLLAVPSTGLA